LLKKFCVPSSVFVFSFTLILPIHSTNRRQTSTKVGTMSARTLIEKLHKAWRNFGTANGGNVLVTFALTTIPVMGFVGSAVDYSRANSAKAEMQAAVDATALMLSKNISTLTTSQISTEATNYFNALFNRTEVSGIVITPTYTTTGGSQVVVTGAGSVPTTFMKVMGISTMNINVSSTVKWGNSRLRVALALDNTGSMADNGKIGALKTATKALLSQLKNAAAANGDVLVSIIPFSKDVNVGATNYSASWIDWTEWDAANGSSGGTFSGSVCISGTLYRVSGSSWVSGGNCTGNGPGICASGTLWKWNGSAFYNAGNCSTTNHSSWNGCITDRGGSSAPASQNYDQNVLPPVTSDKASLYPAEQYTDCPLQMMGLGYDWTTMNTLVDNMYPDGYTNQPIGLVWAWLSLVGGGPLAAPAMSSSYTYNQVIILLSDGLNTEDRWYVNQTPIDNRMYNPSNGTGTCANIKAAGITIYTIQVNTGGDPTSTLLRNCASDPSKFFLLTSASAIVTAFNQIGTNLSNLRVAK
jgi:Flp pilus assembly protein TadG